MKIMAPGRTHLGAFTMTLLCLQQLTTKGLDPRTFPPSLIGKLINLYLLGTSCCLLWIQNPEVFCLPYLIQMMGGSF
jgi:hypothetical protein